MADPTVPVHVGFTWTSAMMALANVLIGGVLVALIRSRPQMRKLANDREANLLEERAEEMAGMRETIKKLEARIDIRDTLHEAERAFDRHRYRNLSACLNSFLMLVKANPSEAAKAAEMIEEMRARQTEEENKENLALKALAARLTEEKHA